MCSCDLWDWDELMENINIGSNKQNECEVEGHVLRRKNMSLIVVERRNDT